MTDRRDLELLAIGWDAAISAMQYEDGTPVEIGTNINPYREKLNQAEHLRRFYA